MCYTLFGSWSISQLLGMMGEMVQKGQMGCTSQMGRTAQMGKIGKKDQML